MKRLYYLCDDLRVCGSVARALREAGISDWNFHVLSRDELGVYQHRIHAATAYQRLDVIHAGERWGLAGVGMGAVVAALAYAVQPFPWQVDGFAVALMTLAAGFFAAWRGAVIGLSRDNYKILPFSGDLDAGRHLVMVDVSDGNRARVREIMNVQFPSLEFCGRDSTFIGPFANHHTPAPGSAGR